jgi:rhamnosyl/mannosyltransferase
VKILHVYKDYPPVYGGIENHIRTLVLELARRNGFDLEVLVTGPSHRTTREIDQSVRVVRAGRQLEVARTPLSWQLGREMMLRRPDVTHLHFPYPMGELAQLLVGRGRRLVITYHSDIVRQRGWLRLYRPAVARVLQRADRIVVTSRTYGLGSRWLAPWVDKCVVIPHGIDPCRFEAADPARVAAVQRAWPGPLVLFVGRFRYYKGLSYLVEAARWIRGRVLLVGGGPMEAALRAQVEQLDLGDKVAFAGDVDDEWLPAYYRAADVFVLPAVERSEAFGLVQLEAMASERPVVCTELGTGTSYVNLHGETGFVVPPRDALAIAAAVNRLLGDPELRTRFGAMGRSRVVNHFQKDRMAERMAMLYRSLVSEPGEALGVEQLR